MAWIDASDPPIPDPDAEAKDRARRLRVVDRWASLGGLVDVEPPDDLGAADREASEGAAYDMLDSWLGAD